MPTALIVESSSAYPVDFSLGAFGGGYTIDAGTSFYSFFITCRLADSAFALADSIYVSDQYGHFISHNPEKYVDSVYDRASLGFHIPPHTSLRIPIQMRAYGKGEEQSFEYDFSATSDSVGITRSFDSYLNLRCIAACSAPFFPFDSTPITNKANTYNQDCAVTNNNGDWQFGATDYPVGSTSHVSFQIAGEFPDSYRLPDDMDYQTNHSYATIFDFLGAPISPVYDTLITTSTDCSGTGVTRTPIVCYTSLVGSCNLNTQSGPLIAPFMGSAKTSMTLINNSSYAVVISNLHATGRDSANFLVTGPDTLGAL
ncbi:MAG TPA: hypothetical protein VFX22_10010, partial [Candidatus Kapabacteria bacterium]|nr:hypothetical protein [Candidatus Kapabacteria bacterium]